MAPDPLCDTLAAQQQQTFLTFSAYMPSSQNSEEEALKPAHHF